jgi:integrase/recombinase XerD
MSGRPGILDLYAFPAARRELPVGETFPAPPFGHAAEAFVIAHAAPGAWSAGTAVKYRQTLAALGGRLAGIAPAAAGDVAVLGTPAGASALQAAFTSAFGGLAPATRARHLSALRSALAWWAGAGWLDGDPTAGWARPKIPVDTTRALTRAQVAAIWRLDVPLRDKALWRMLYETAARAEEILGLDVPDLDLPSKRGRVISKGGTTDWVHWQTGTAMLLPRLLAGRREGPVFLTARKPGRAVSTGDLCPVTGRARLSYRRAAESFELATPSLGQPRSHRRGAGEAARLDPPPAAALPAHPRSRRRHQHPHAARPVPACLRPIPRALRAPRARSRRPPRRTH